MTLENELQKKLSAGKRLKREKKALLETRGPLEILSHEVNGCMNPSCIALVYKFDRLKTRLMSRHTSVSLKWRDQSFYYKKRAKELEAFIIKNGLNVSDAFVKQTNETNPKEETPHDPITLTREPSKEQ